MIRAVKDEDLDRVSKFAYATVIPDVLEFLQMEEKAAICEPIEGVTASQLFWRYKNAVTRLRLARKVSVHTKKIDGVVTVMLRKVE